METRRRISHAVIVAEPKRKKKDSYSSLAGTLFLQPFHLPFLFLKSIPLLHGDLHVTHHDCRPWIVILYWSWVNSYLLDKYQTVCLFQVNRWNNNCNMFKICGILYVLKIHSNNESEITKINQDWLFGICRTSLNKMLQEVTQMEGK